jgi:hypothetical protein
MAASRPVSPLSASTTTSSPELDELRAEVERLRALVGPSEEAYVKLRLDLLGAKDVAVGAEAEVGRLRGQVMSLQAEVLRLERDFVWFRHSVLRRLKALAARRPGWRQVAIRLRFR